MPKPGKNEKQSDFHSRCMKAMTDEGKPEDQANAACYSMWSKRESVEEQLPQPRTSNTPAVIEPGQPREKQYEFMARCIPSVKAKYENLDDEGATAMCFTLWNSRYESVHPADAMIREASEVDWSQVDKTRLPSSCFLMVGDKDKKGTWHLPVYMGAGGIEPKTGMYREAGEINLQALRAADATARSGKFEVPASVKARLNYLLRLHEDVSHYKAYRTPALQESADAPSHLVETIDFKGAEFVEENGARIVRNVVMLGPESSHGYGYKQEAMAGAVKKGLYEGCRIFINHAKEGRDLMQLAGVFRETRHEDGKVKGNAHLLDDAYGKKFWDIAKTMPQAAGCSHVADGRLVKGPDGKQCVEEITKVYSVDLVVQGATTQNVFEGEMPPGVTNMEWKDVTLASLKENQPAIYHNLFEAGAKSRDEEIQALINEKQALTKASEKLTAESQALAADKNKLTEENKQLQAKLDEAAVLEATRQKEAVVAKLCADLPEQARTEVFKQQCMEVKTGATGFDIKVFEAKVTELVKDRKALCEQGGVRNAGGEQNRTTQVSEEAANKTLTL